MTAFGVVTQGLLGTDQPYGDRRGFRRWRAPMTHSTKPADDGLQRVALDHSTVRPWLRCIVGTRESVGAGPSRSSRADIVTTRDSRTPKKGFPPRGAGQNPKHYGPWADCRWKGAGLPAHLLGYEDIQRPFRKSGDVPAGHEPDERRRSQHRQQRKGRSHRSRRASRTENTPWPEG